MEWQLWLVAAAVALSAGYVVRQTWRSWRGGKGGCGGCGKHTASVTPSRATPNLISADELTARLRSRR